MQQTETPKILPYHIQMELDKVTFKKELDAIEELLKGKTYREIIRIKRVIKETVMNSIIF